MSKDMLVVSQPVAFQYVQCFFRSGIELRFELGLERNEAINRSSLRELAVMASFLTWVCGPHVCITPVNSCPANSGFPLLKADKAAVLGLLQLRASTSALMAPFHLYTRCPGSSPQQPGPVSQHRTDLQHRALGLT